MTARSPAHDLRQIGTAYVGEREVPRWEPATGQSAVEAATQLGLRLLSRREVGDAVAVVDTGDGSYARAVRVVGAVQS